MLRILNFDILSGEHFLTFNKPSLGSCDLTQKLGSDRFRYFHIHLRRTDKQTEKRNIDNVYLETLKVLKSNNQKTLLMYF